MKTTISLGLLAFLAACGDGASLEEGDFATSDQALSPAFSDGTWGGWNQGAGIALAQVDGDPRPDMVFVRVDAPSGSNRGLYRVGYNIDRVGGSYEPTSFGPPVGIPGGIGDTTAGAGVAIADLNRNGRPDIIFVYRDAPSRSTDRSYYRIGWDMNGAGFVSGWSNVKEFRGGFNGATSAGLDVAVKDLNGDGRPDLVVAVVDDPSNDNYVYWSVGFDLDNNGDVQGGFGPTYTKARGIGFQTEDMGLSIADMNRDGHDDLVVSWVDDPGGANTHYVQIGYDLSAQGTVRAWGPVRVVNGAVANTVNGAGIIAYDFDGNGSTDIMEFHLWYNGSGNNGYLSTAFDRSDRNYSVQFKGTHNCLSALGSAQNLVEAPCNGADLQQRWVFAADDAGYVSLVNLGTGKCAAIENGSTSQLSPNFIQEDCQARPRQEFSVINATQGYKTLKARVSGLCVESMYPSVAKISQATCEDQYYWDPQRITLIP